MTYLTAWRQQSRIRNGVLHKGAPARVLKLAASTACLANSCQHLVTDQPTTAPLPGATRQLSDTAKQLCTLLLLVNLHLSLPSFTAFAMGSSWLPNMAGDTPAPVISLPARLQLAVIHAGRGTPPGGSCRQVQGGSLLCRRRVELAPQQPRVVHQQLLQVA